MSIMDIFKGNSSSQQQQAATPPAAGAPASAPAPGAPAQQAAAPASADTSPMDAYKDLWQNTQQQGTTAPSPLAIDQSKLSEVVSKANFASGLTPELVQKASSGDSEAFIEAMNIVSRQAFQQAITANSTLTQQAFDHHKALQEKELPSMVRSSMVRQDLATNPLYKHEATRPILSAIEAQLSAKYPTATAAEIADHAKTYLADFAKLAAGNGTSQQAGEQAPKGQDFDNW